MTQNQTLQRIRIWDLPTRIFHVLLILSIAGLIITGEVGGDAMPVHFLFGYNVLALVLFRVVWGVFGGHWSRFRHFIPTPSELLAYVRSLRTGHSTAHVGHNPLGCFVCPRNVGYSFASGLEWFLQ